MSAHAMLLLATTLFSIFVVYYYKNTWEKKKEIKTLEKYAEAVLVSAKKHFAELKDKEMLLVVDKGYGVVDNSKWENELDNFTCLVIEPTLQEQKIDRFESTEQKRKFMLFAKDMIKDLLCYDAFPVTLTAKEYLEGRKDT